ncbi:MAG: hypothetical protein PQJ59_17135 [Spirochaetales bacterium]|nr:hypothetical protein [Spirochaetales bacterium]
MLINLIFLFWARADLVLPLWEADPDRGEELCLIIQPGCRDELVGPGCYLRSEERLKGERKELTRGDFRLILTQKEGKRLEKLILFYRITPIRTYLFHYRPALLGQERLTSIEVDDGKGQFLYRLNRPFSLPFDG